MSFEEYLKQGEVAREAAKLFRYSDRKLPEYPDPDETQKAEILATAQEIARDVAAKFDAARTEQAAVIDEHFAQMQSYWNAPVPAGSLPTPPPISRYQSLVMALGHWLETCKSFVPDADLLVAAGAGEFKAYLQPILDDATKALAAVQATPTAIFSQSPANQGAGPGPDPNFPPLNPFLPAPPIPGVAPSYGMPSMGMPGMGMPFGGPMMPPGMGYPGMDPFGGFGGMMPPGMTPGMFPPAPPMPTYTPLFGGPMMPGPMTPIAPAPAPGGRQPWQDEFDANAKRLREEQAKRDADHARFIAQIKS